MPLKWPHFGRSVFWTFYLGTRNAISDTPKMPILGVLGVSEMVFPVPEKENSRKQTPSNVAILEPNQTEGLVWVSRIFFLATFPIVIPM